MSLWYWLVSIHTRYVLLFPDNTGFGSGPDNTHEDLSSDIYTCVCTCTCNSMLHLHTLVGTHLLQWLCHFHPAGPPPHSHVHTPLPTETQMTCSSQTSPGGPSGLAPSAQNTHHVYEGLHCKQCGKQPASQRTLWWAHPLCMYRGCMHMLYHTQSLTYYTHAVMQSNSAWCSPHCSALKEIQLFTTSDLTKLGNES